MFIYIQLQRVLLYARLSSMGPPFGWMDGWAPKFHATAACGYPTDIMMLSSEDIQNAHDYLQINLNVNVI